MLSRLYYIVYLEYSQKTCFSLKEQLIFDEVLACLASLISNNAIYAVSDSCSSPFYTLLDCEKDPRTGISQLSSSKKNEGIPS